MIEDELGPALEQVGEAARSFQRVEHIALGDALPGQRAALAGDFAQARCLHLQYYPLFKDLFIEPNPVPIKAALALAGQMEPGVRLPLCEMGEATQRRLEATLRQLQLIR